MPPKKQARMDTDTDPRIDKIALQLLQVMRRMEEIKAAQAKQLVPFKEVEDKLKGRLMAWMDANGVQSVKTDEGTVSLRSRDSASIALDPDAFMTFVIESERFELLERRANANACKDFADETGKLPPGVKINTLRYLAIKEPT